LPEEKEKASRVPGAAELRTTVDELLADGTISEAQAWHLHESLEEQDEASRYVLKHFGVHLAIGAVFAFDVVPLPLGTIGRVGWVAIARVTETLRGNFERARVHSLRVFLVAAIPLLGYVAYLVPLRRDHKELAFVLANNIWKKRTGRSYEEFVAARPRLTAGLVRRLVPLPWPADSIDK